MVPPPHGGVADEDFGVRTVVTAMFDTQCRAEDLQAVRRAPSAPPFPVAAHQATNTSSGFQPRTSVVVIVFPSHVFPSSIAIRRSPSNAALSSRAR